MGGLSVSTKLTTIAIAAGALMLATPSFAQSPSLSATIINTSGESIGTVAITVSPNGLLVHTEVSGLEPGAHAYNLHEVGECSTTPPARPEEPAIFDSAGGHINPDDKRHGFLRDVGPHAGDMPNLIVPESGSVTVEFFVPGVTLDMVMDADGSAVVIRANPDDYLSGSAGARIGCGVIEQSM